MNHSPPETPTEERRGKKSKEKTNATYETTDAQTQKNLNRVAALERSVENQRVVTVGKVGRWGGRSVLNQFSLRETSPLVLMQLQIRNMCLVHIKDIFFIC